MDELRAQAKVHVTDNYIHVIMMEIKSLEKFYEAKVLAAGSILEPAVARIRVRE